MILLCDEDIGTNVPQALYLVRRNRTSYNTISILQKGWQSWKDPRWLKIAGEKQWLVFSANKRMLTVAEEVNTIINEKVGIVYLTNGEEHIDKVLWLLLVKWKWLENIDKNEQRPFAYFLSPKGRIKKQTLKPLKI
ncbi:MAG: hypothetical protein Q8O43_01655 [Dehalococcoidia bacterium]|nr:hypothetical protein [Dehalococcoidia bacterium]